MEARSSGWGPDQAGAILDDVRRLQRTTRQARQGFWFPVLLLGLLVLASAPLYATRPPRKPLKPPVVVQGGIPLPAPTTTLEPCRPRSREFCSQRPFPRLAACPPGVASTTAAPCLPAGDSYGVSCVFSRPPGHAVKQGSCSATVYQFQGQPTSRVVQGSPLDSHLYQFFGFGGDRAGSTLGTDLFWLVGIAICYTLTALFYLRQGARRGVATSPWIYLLTGIGLILLVGLLSGRWVSFLPLWFLPGDLTGRGLLVLLPVSTALVVLAVNERSRALVCFSLFIVALVLIANLYDIANVFYRIHLGVSGLEANNLTVAAALLIGGLAFGLLSWRRIRLA